MFTSWNDSAFEISRINLIEFCIFVTSRLYIISFSEKISSFVLLPKWVLFEKLWSEN